MRRQVISPPGFLQIVKNFLKRKAIISTCYASDILRNKELWLGVIQDGKTVRIERAKLAVKSFLFSYKAEIITREAIRKGIDFG